MSQTGPRRAAVVDWDPVGALGEDEIRIHLDVNIGAKEDPGKHATRDAPERTRRASAGCVVDILSYT